MPSLVASSIASTPKVGYVWVGERVQALPEARVGRAHDEDAEDRRAMRRCASCSEEGVVALMRGAVLARRRA